MRKTVFILVFVIALPAAAQYESARVTALSSDCSNGIKHDGGTFTAWMSLTDITTPKIAVMKFDLPPGTTGLKEVCAALELNGATSPTFAYSFVVYDDDGFGGQPGTLLKSITGIATLPQTIGVNTWVSADFANSGLVLDGGPVYVGVRVAATGVWLALDYNTKAPSADMLWTTVTNGIPWNAGGYYGNAMFAIRLGSLGTCTASETAMCLNGGRFKVEATYASESATGSARVVKLTDETGYFWFFSSSNVEAIVKVLNGCSVNNGFWVYAGGLTDVNTTLRITDTKTGAVKTYANPQGTPFQPIQDVNAFNTAGTCN